jgi:hypothetical protein
MLNKNPCKICLVQPSCTTPCSDKYNHAKTKLRRLNIVQRNLVPFIISLGCLIYLCLNFLVPHISDDGLIIVMMSILILFIMCGIALIIEVKYLIPQISYIETLTEAISNKIDGDWQ